VGAADVDLLRALLAADLRGLRDRRRRGDHVVHEDHVAAFHLADDVHDLGLGGAAAALVDDRQVGVEPLGVGARHLDAAHVGRDDGQVLEVELAEVLDEDRRRVEVVHRDVEEALELRGVQVDRQRAGRARRGDDVSRRASR
jgi:hypothetical protein